MSQRMPSFLQDLVRRLRRRGLALGVDDCIAVRKALAAGFGLGSSDELLALCITLWSKSRRDTELITATFHLVGSPRWVIEALPDQQPRASVDPQVGAPAVGDGTASSPRGAAPDTETLTLLPPGHGDDGADEIPSSGDGDLSLVLRPQYPFTEREIAQTWRRLRRPRREGPPVELDPDASIRHYAATGVVTAPVLRPARVNAAHLFLLIDRQGSMAPYHGLVDYVVASIVNAGRLDTMTLVYLENTPGESTGRHLLADLPDPLGGTLDLIVDRIPALESGLVYSDRAMSHPRPFAQLLTELTPGAAAVVISDAGALRGRFLGTRVLDSLAFLRALAARGAHIAWLNPVPERRWPGTTAGALARHVPMFPLTRDGMYRAIDVLRGHPVDVEVPL